MGKSKKKQMEQKVRETRWRADNKKIHLENQIRQYEYDLKKGEQETRTQFSIMMDELTKEMREASKDYVGKPNTEENRMELSLVLAQTLLGNEKGMFRDVDSKQL